MPHKPQGSSAEVFQRTHAVMMEIIRQVVAAVAIIDLTRADIQDGAKKSHEHTGLVIATDLGVQAREDFTRGAAVAGGGFEQGLGHGHKERRGNSLAGDVADGETEVSGIDE